MVQGSEGDRGFRDHRIAPICRWWSAAPSTVRAEPDPDQIERGARLISLCAHAAYASTPHLVEAQGTGAAACDAEE